MKKNLLFVCLLLLSTVVFAQAPGIFNYQGVARNAVGNVLANKNITLRVSIRDNAANGPVVFTETRAVTTNGFGLFNVQIGSPGATSVTGAVLDVDWANGLKFIQVELDPEGGSGFINAGTSQLASVPYALNAGPASSLLLPFEATENSAVTLFSITNEGDAVSIEGVNTTSTSSVAAVRGLLSSTAPGGFASGVRGISNGTGGLGIGVWGSHAGSGWGVYGATPNGLGVYGNASAAGTGVYANSSTGTGLQATSNSGVPADFTIFNNANNNSVLKISSVGTGDGIEATMQLGKGVFATSENETGVEGITNAQTAAGVIGRNNGGGEAVVGITTSDIGGAVVGRNDGAGYGVRGFVATDQSGQGIGVFGQVGLNNSRGRAGRFVNVNQQNITPATLEVETNSGGDPGVVGDGAAINTKVDNTNSVAPAVRAEVNTIFGNFGAAGIYGIASGTGGFAGLFHQSNPAGNGSGLVTINDGGGNASVSNSGDGDAIVGTVDGEGRSLYAWVPSFSPGRAAEFRNFNEDNDNAVVSAQTVGNGNAAEFFVNNNLGTSAGVVGTVNSIFANFGTAGVYGRNDGTGGVAGLFYTTVETNPRPSLLALTDGTGEAIVASSGDGNGVETTSDGTGNSLYAWKPNFATGTAGRFQNFNAANSSPTAWVLNNGTGDAVLINHSGSSGNIASFQSGGTNMARINKAGRGFFNGGTQNNGADIAEAFDVAGSLSSYEPGDVLVISTSTDRQVEKSSGAYSTLVAGVYATKPGVLLTEESMDTDISDKVPMGVVGVIPTKVCLEGGAIRRGDMVVTSSIPGVAMKADPEKVKFGQVIGKALQDYDAQEVGKINILVNVK